MRGGTAALLVLVLLTPAAAGGQRVSIESAIDSLVQRELGARPIAGMVVGVVRGEDTLFLRSYGTANLEHRVPLDVGGVFQIASLTKQFTAAAVLRLVEEGRLGLDDDVGKYLPDLETHGAVVRIRHLLNHTSGVPNIYEMRSWPRIRPLRVPRSEVLAMEMAGVAGDSLDFAPGSDFHYSNTGYHFLGDVIESVTGETVESWFQHALFEPAGLERTGFCPWARIVPDRVPGYEPDSTGTRLENAWRQSQTVLFTSGAICSTARDLLRWNAALHGGSILGVAGYRAMTTPEGAANSYGYGLYVDSLEGHRRFRHNGYTPGYSSQLEYYPDDDMAVVVLANSPAAVGGLAEAVGRVVLGLPARKVPVRPEGWVVQPLAAGVDTTTIHFRRMGAGMHVTAGPAAVYFHPDSIATDAHELTAEFTATGGPADTDLGLVFGGSVSGGLLETYSAVLVRSTGQYAVMRHTASRDTLLVAWKESAAVATSGTNRLSVSVDGGGVRLRINDVLVESIPSGEPGHTDGVFGLRLGADADVHVSGFGRGVTDTRGAAKRHAPTPDGTGLEQITVQDRSALARAGASDRSAPPTAQ